MKDKLIESMRVNCPLFDRRDNLSCVRLYADATLDAGSAYPKFYQLVLDQSYVVVVQDEQITRVETHNGTLVSWLRENALDYDEYASRNEFCTLYGISARPTVATLNCTGPFYIWQELDFGAFVDTNSPLSHYITEAERDFHEDADRIVSKAAVFDRYEDAVKWVKLFESRPYNLRSGELNRPWNTITTDAPGR